MAKEKSTIEVLMEVKRNLPVHEEQMEVLACLTRVKFLALKKEGFTDEQAIELCKTL